MPHACKRCRRAFQRRRPDDPLSLLQPSGSSLFWPVSYIAWRTRPSVFEPGRPYPLPYLNLPLETVMGKYFLGWILGVPVFVLVIAYFFFH